MKIKQKLMVLTCVSALLLSACDNASSDSKDDEKAVLQTQGTQTVQTIEELTSDAFDEADLAQEFDKAKSVSITFEDSKVTSEGAADSGVAIDGTTATIQKGGDYYVTGTCGNGKIVVESDAAENVRIILDNITLTNDTGSAIYIKKSAKTIITTAQDSVNSITDRATYKEKGTSATIFSESDLSINGAGQLSVISNYADTIASKADLKIASGVMNLQSKRDGLAASKGVSIKNGSFQLRCGRNAIRTTSEKDTEGFIGFESGNFDIQSGADICNATGSIYYINGGFTGGAGYGSVPASTEPGWGKVLAKNTTAKGLKAGKDIEIYGGSLTFDTTDDTLYAGNDVTVKNGCIIASSGDDGIVSKNEISVNGGSVTLQKCFNGLEGTNVKLEGGFLDITSFGDGINAANGQDSFATEDRPGKNDIKREGQGTVNVDNTCINIRSNRDGINVAGDLSIAGGAVRIHSGEQGKGTSIACSGKYDVKGGALFAAGTEKEMAAPSQLSQPALSLQYPKMQDGDAVVCIKDSSDKIVFAFGVASEFDKVLISQPIFEKGKEYTWYQAKFTSDLSQKFGEVQEEEMTIGDKIATFKVGDGLTKVDANGVVK